MNNNLVIEQIEIESLTPYANNSKIHTKNQIVHIANSIKEFGFNDPLAIAGTNNIVLEGNGRIEAAKLLGLTTLPCIRLDHLSTSEQRAYIIAHNSLNLETGFDESILMKELQELGQFDFKEFGIETEKYIANLERIEEKELRPYAKVHYLITLDINQHDKIAEYIEKISLMEGIEVDSSLD